MDSEQDTTSTPTSRPGKRALRPSTGTRWLFDELSDHTEFEHLSGNSGDGLPFSTADNEQESNMGLMEESFLVAIESEVIPSSIVATSDNEQEALMEQNIPSSIAFEIPSDG